MSRHICQSQVFTKIGFAFPPESSRKKDGQKVLRNLPVSITCTTFATIFSRNAPGFIESVIKGWTEHMTDHFSRRFREGISFPNFVERFILKLPLSKIRAVPFALQNRALFEGRTARKRAQTRGARAVGSRGGKKEKGRVKTG